jgi:hypothetical protein
MKYFLILTISILCACALRTPQGLATQKPDYQYVGKSTNFVALTECILKKVDNYPVAFTVFDFEDQTLPVHIRQFSDNAELYQEIGGQALTLIKLKKLSPNKTEAKLYTGNSTINGRVRENYPNLIKSCFK